ncbi:MAG: multicopper oxidase domain-containing protein [Chlamydiales bacterium]|nr:multicopper oxidase domain-containing protein [Chlamydiales bacterium]
MFRVKSILFIISLLTAFMPVLEAKLIKYDIDIDYKLINISGKEVQAVALDKKIPGPVIKANVGDTLEATFHNHLDEESSIHWHGILLPNEQDGVPNLTTASIPPGGSHTYKFKVSHAGTYWYHSHSNMQKQRGVYGGIVFSDNKQNLLYEEDYVAILSDWSDSHPMTIMRNLRKEGDYYAFEKGSELNWLEMIKRPPGVIKNHLKSSLQRMQVMDVSDVANDAFLVNGAKQQYIKTVRKDNSVRVRLINASASTYFDVRFAGKEMRVIAADGIDIKPFVTKQISMAIGESYDIIVNIEDDKSYELRADAEDRTGYASILIGNGKQQLLPDLPPIDYYPSEEEHHHHHQPKQAYADLKAKYKTSLDDKKPWREVNLSLTGNMHKFVWSFDNKLLSESDTIKIRRGENIRFNLTNETMMHHPLHLHGHFFRVVNKHNEYSPLKHTVSIPPNQTVTIEFEANAEKDWFFHCHNLYHLHSGMGRVVSYQEKEENPLFNLDQLAADTHYFMSGEFKGFSNLVEAELKISNARNSFIFNSEYLFENQDYDINLVYERNLSDYLDVYIGANSEKENKEKVEHSGVVGIKYVLPLFIKIKAQIYSRDDLLVSIGNEHRLAENVLFSWQYDSERRYKLMFSYQYSKLLQLAVNYDSKAYFGAGVYLNF